MFIMFVKVFFSVVLADRDTLSLQKKKIRDSNMQNIRKKSEEKIRVLTPFCF